MTITGSGVWRIANKNILKSYSKAVAYIYFPCIYSTCLVDFSIELIEHIKRK